VPDFPHTPTPRPAVWTNFHGTIENAQVDLLCVPESPRTDPEQRMHDHAAALDAIVRHCFDQTMRVRMLGAGWSLSNVIRPNHVFVDPAHMNAILSLDPGCTTQAYRTFAAPHRGVPVLVENGTHVSRINRVLAESFGLALRTSGAGNGHRIAGCIATGTHGAAIGVGAVHDTVLALHVLVGPGRAVLLQPSTPWFSPALAARLASVTGIPTEDRPGDDAFHAAQVSLGSIGIVLGVVLDAVPLYGLRRRVIGVAHDDPKLDVVLEVLANLDYRRLYPTETEAPYHFQVIYNPYPSAQSPAAYVNAMWREETAPPATHPGTPAPDGASDLIAVIAHLVQGLSGAIPDAIIRSTINRRLEDRYRPGDYAPAIPGEVFGQTQLPPGEGTSIELVVNQPDLRVAIPLILDTLRTAADDGHHHLGAIGVRLVRKTDALLGMNIHPISAFIELPSVRNQDAIFVHNRVWTALDARGIRYTCHWGQLHNLTKPRLQVWYGDRLDRWVAAREALLEPKGRTVFRSDLLGDVGL